MKRAGNQIVLVGTYRPENADWIAAKRLYNQPLPKCGKLAFHARDAIASALTLLLLAATIVCKVMGW